MATIDMPLSACTIDRLYPDRPIPLVIRPRGSTPNSVSFLLQWIELHRERLMHMLHHQSGALLFRDWDITSAEQFEKVCLLFKKDLSTEYLGTSPRTPMTKYVFTSSEITPLFPIPQHSEMAFLGPQHKPDFIFFSCMQPSEVGGQTPISDAVGTLKDMDPRVREKFLRLGVHYVRNYDGPTGRTWDPLKLKRWPAVWNTTDKKKVDGFCAKDGVKASWYGPHGDKLRLDNVVPATMQHPSMPEVRVWSTHAHTFHISTATREMKQLAQKFGLLYYWLVFCFIWLLMTVKRRLQKDDEHGMNALYGDGTVIPDEDMAEVSASVWKNTVFWEWAKGDVIVIDNHLVSHGRTPYRGRRLILTAFG